MLVIAFVNPLGQPDGTYLMHRHQTMREDITRPELSPKFKHAAEAVNYAIERGMQPPDKDGYTIAYTVLSLLTGAIELAQARAHTEWMEAHPR